MSIVELWIALALGAIFLIWVINFFKGVLARIAGTLFALWWAHREEEGRK